MYVTTLTINSPGAKGAISPLVFVKTKFGSMRLFSRVFVRRRVRCCVVPSPVILKGEPVSGTDFIRVEWEKPEQPNGVITHYMVTYDASVDVLPVGRDYCQNRTSLLSL